MAYPSFTVTYESGEQQLFGRQIDRATNGTPKIRQLYAGVKKTFKLKHQALNATDKATLEAFWAANALNSFTFTWPADGVAYTVVFGADDPVFTPVPVNRWDAEVLLVQV